METIIIPIKKGQNLAEALKAKGYKTIPSNVIFDKTLTGIGATYMEIFAKRNSIIIEPNVPVIVFRYSQNSVTGDAGRIHRIVPEINKFNFFR